MPRAALALPLLGLLAACSSASSGGGDDPVPRRTEVRIEVPSEWDGLGPTSGLKLETESSVASFGVQAPLTQVWKALGEVYEEMGVPITEENPLDGVMGNPGFRPRRIDGTRLSRFLDCGHTLTGAKADAYQVTMQILTVVRPAAAGGTRVMTDLDASARPRSTSGSSVHCVSTGRLEELLAERIESQLGGEG